MKEIGLYIHIPFCKQKCYYCDFVSYPNKINCVDKYIETVINEYKNYKAEEYIIKTIYIGGGTPSIIDSKKIYELINEIDLKEVEEITIEVNPGTVNEEKLVDYKNMGINRISIGLQSTKNEILREIGRIHSYEEFLNTYNLARKAGFRNINVDLMLGLPNQTIDDLEESVSKVIDLNPEHISIYSLILEEGTKLYELVQNNKCVLPSEETERAMYWMIKNKLEKAGYIHYEISNFAKEGFESHHNVDCWKQKEYIGLGAAAHSYLDGRRFSNNTNIDEYISDFTKKETHEVQNKLDQEKEFMILGLRMLDGVMISKFEEKFNENPIYLFRNELNKLVENNLIEVDLNDIKLTSKGLDLANLVWEEFV